MVPGILMSPRGKLLLYQGDDCRFPVVTVELYPKWYGVYLVSPGPTQHTRAVEEVPFPDMGDYEKLGSPYVDHAPNPRHVCKWAAEKGYSVDTESLEMMIGRWELECGAGRYDSLFEEVREY